MVQLEGKLVEVVHQVTVFGLGRVLPHLQSLLGFQVDQVHALIIISFDPVLLHSLCILNGSCGEMVVLRIPFSGSKLEFSTLSGVVVDDGGGSEGFQIHFADDHVAHHHFGLLDDIPLGLLLAASHASGEQGKVHMIVVGDREVLPLELNLGIITLLVIPSLAFDERCSDGRVVANLLVQGPIGGSADVKRLTEQRVERL